MGFMKQFKDMKDMTAAAPGMIDQAQQMQASAQQMQAAQQAQMAQAAQAAQSAQVAAAPADDLESINGVSLTQFAQISRGLAAYNYDQSKAVDLAAEQGIAAGDWQAALDGWNARIAADPAVASRFSDLYAGEGLIMGFFKDVNTLKKQAKEIERNSPPVKDRMADATQRMAQANDFMAAQAAATTAATQALANGDPAKAQVVSAQPSGASMGYDPILAIQLLVFQPGQPPRPVTVSTTVPQIHLSKAQAGASVAVSVDRTNPANVAIQWDQPA